MKLFETAGERLRNEMELVQALKDTESRNNQQIDFLKTSHQKEKAELEAELKAEKAKVKELEEKSKKFEQIYLQMGKLFAPNPQLPPTN